MSSSVDVVIWLVIGLLGLPVCLWVLGRKRRTLGALDERRPEGLLARLLVNEELARLAMLIGVLTAGVLAFAAYPWRGTAIRRILIGIEVLIVAKSLLWFRYERQMDALQKRATRTRADDPEDTNGKL